MVEGALQKKGQMRRINRVVVFYEFTLGLLPDTKEAGSSSLEQPSGCLHSPWIKRLRSIGDPDAGEPLEDLVRP